MQNAIAQYRFLTFKGKLITFVAVAFAYFVTAKLGLMVPYKESVATLIWLPTGIAVGAIMRWGRVSIPAVFVASLLVELTVLPLTASVLIAITNTLGPLLAAYLLPKLRFNHHLYKQKDIFLMIAVALIGMSVCATGGTFSLYITGLAPTDKLSSIWFIWWLGDSLGVLLALPLVLNLGRKGTFSCNDRCYQLLAWIILFVCVELIIVSAVPDLNKQFILSMFVILPMLIWASMSFGLVGGSFFVIILSSIAVWVTSQGSGNFYSHDLSEGVFSLWTFMVALVVTMLLISALQSERNLAHMTIQKNDKKLRSVIDGAFDAIVTIDSAGLLVEFNPAAERIFGYKKEDVLGKSMPDLIIPARYRNAHHAGHQQYKMTGVTHIFNQRIELVGMRADGSEFPIELTLTALKDNNLSLVTGFVRDISEQKRARQEIENFAYYDALTSLPNRRLLADRYQHAMSIAQRAKTYCALLFIDLDKFKVLNDTKGHDVGDQLLIEVAHRIQHTVRAGDTVARLSGDEFVVILESLDQNASIAYQQVSEIAQKLLAELNRNYYLSLFEFATSASIGVTLFNDNALTFEDHLRHADTAMYLSKDSGGNTYRFYDQLTQESIEKNFALEAALGLALANQELYLNYQPIVNVAKQVVAAEVLLRWSHPTLGNVSPVEFIPIAEKSNLIIKIGHWVLEQACEQLKTWEASPVLGQIKLSVNISAKQFLYINFVQELREILARTGINPSLLKLELTETAVIDNMDDVIHKIGILRQMGVRIALDDFGIGHSSLVYLKKLPVTQIKIDQSFVHDVLTDSNDAAIIQMVLAVGKTIHCDIVAEGVEQVEQFELLREFGCDYFQGYYFSRPVNVANFEQFVSAS
ncbi:bifunctional diguanylate cyclase/phosphodiesterase [Methylotenera mobilis]|uniref:Diguanylate cyclase/phosphodiesterase with PAS/PAC sensor(S) n=1 Tax=Methylotenera mobilis (strain JLW8 / ATCC BAA-1282 / DSM 17540) TaxID=583345 RepID=C6WT76_METML|nr:EAL domain-containing protein [Methylotenera mobilis]ACT49138.1 diguanylate cyclase/phosphodiesterase with PAS/PAC sensor(s) [Methylotenera mobilis JLW8]